MTDEQWAADLSRTVQVVLDGHGIKTPDMRGAPILDATFLVVFHANPEDREVKLPNAEWGTAWRRVLDTERGFARETVRFAASAKIAVKGRSLWVFQREAP
jgi:isoamylase